MTPDKVFKYYRTFALFNPEDFTPDERQAWAQGVEHALRGGRITENPYVARVSMAEVIAWDAGYMVAKGDKNCVDSPPPLPHLGRVGGG
jgi:hypothetical protein